jgi:hypothetical protein
MASRISSVLILFVVILQLCAQTGEARWLAQGVQAAFTSQCHSNSTVPPSPPYNVLNT